MMYIKPGVELKDNQKDCVKGLISRRKALLTDKVGSGKTLSVLYSFAYLKSKGKLNNLFVMTPLSAHVKGVWHSEVSKWTDFKSISIEELQIKVGKSKERLAKYLDIYDIVYSKHSFIKKDMHLVAAIASYKNTVLVLDEVHAFRNAKSSLTIKMRICANYAYALWGMTGSPLSKNLEDTYNIIHLIKPWYFGSFIDFRNTWCTTEEKVIGRTPSGHLRKTVIITGIKDEEAFKLKKEPLVIEGKSFLNLKFNYVDYTMSPQEASLYRKVANGVTLNEHLSSEDWLKTVLSLDEQEQQNHPIKDLNAASSRFIYLQSAADGILTPQGNQNNFHSEKISVLVDLVRKIVEKKESVIVFVEYYVALEAINKALVEARLHARIIESSGRNVLGENDLTEGKVMQVPHIVLATKASSESISLYFINHVIMFHVPTVPHVFVQLNGRITRKNTKFPDDLNCWIFRAQNIDLYKLMVVSAKSYQMELVSGPEGNIPPDYKQTVTKRGMIDRMKKLLLWYT